MNAKTKNLPAKPYIYALGKRKTAGAQVKLFQQGTGVFRINERELKKYFTLGIEQRTLKVPFKLVGLKLKDYDCEIKVQGGGRNSQMEACLHGLTRALVSENHDRRTVLKKAGFLTRDSRIKESKKPGLKRARRAPQFSKR